MRSSDAFGSFHPVMTFAFFACAIALGMFTQHPVFHAVAVICASAYYLSLRGRGGLRTMGVLAVAFVVLSAANPLFNTAGDTVLFTYAGGRAYTAEALAFGASTAAMFVSMMLWFASFTIVMTTDKLTYLFGGVAPALSIVLTMILRLIPHYRRKAGQLAVARACMEGSGEQLGARDRVERGMTVLSALVSWAFEHGMVTADSMRSRGWQAKGRTSFALYRVGARDVAAGIAVAVFALCVVACFASGAAHVEFIPSLVFPQLSSWLVAGLLAYAALLLLPTLVTVKEAVLWRITLSRI